MLIYFLTDYRGPLTNEVFYAQGSKADLPNGEALALIDQGRARAVVNQEPKKAIEAPPKAPIRPEVTLHTPRGVRKDG